MTNPFDFRASQIRTHQIITSGSTGTNAALLIYDYAAASSPLGTIDVTKFYTGSIGTNVYMFVSGTIPEATAAVDPASLFPDTGKHTVITSLIVSGAMTVMSYNPSNAQLMIADRTIATPSDTGLTADINITAGGDSTGGSGGAVTISAGGGNQGGFIDLLAGAGVATAGSADGGNVELVPGDGSSLGGGNNGGGGGYVLGAAGAGGATSTGFAGAGGTIEFVAGNGGGAFGSGSGGIGGHVILLAGSGGSSSFGTSGQAGWIIMANGINPVDNTGGNISIADKSYGKTKHVAIGFNDTDLQSMISNIFLFVSGDMTGDFMNYSLDTPVSESVFGGTMVVSGNMMLRNGLAIGNDTPIGAVVRVEGFTPGDWHSFLQVAGAGWDMGDSQFKWRFEASRSFPQQDNIFDSPSYQIGGWEPTGGGGYQFYNYLEIRSGHSGSTDFPRHMGEIVLGDDKRIGADAFGNNGRTVAFEVHGYDVLSGSSPLDNVNVMGVPLILRSGKGTGTATGSWVAIQAPRRATVSSGSSQLLKDIGIFWHDSRFQVPGEVSSSIPAATAANTGSFYFAKDTGQLFFQKNSTTYIDLTNVAASGTLRRMPVGCYASTTNVSGSSQVCGENYWSPTEMGFVSGSSTITLRTILSTNTGSNKATLQLWNVTSLAFVEIGGPGVTILTSSATTPSRVDSVNLAANVVGFSTSSAAVYEIQLYVSGSGTAILGMAELLNT